MLWLIESMRILRAKIVSLGGVVPRSWPQAMEPNAPAQSPTIPIIAATRVQRRWRCPLITNTSVQPPSSPRADIGMRRKARPTLVGGKQRRRERDREPERQHLPRRGHSQLQAEIGAKRPGRLVAMIGPDPARFEQCGEECRHDRKRRECKGISSQPAARKQPPAHQPEEHSAGEVLIRKDAR